MSLSLKNSLVSLEISEHGAEITKLQYKNNDIIWNASEPWKRHAPILFPIIGKLKDNIYYYYQQVYSLPQHGFARDMQWKLIEQTEKNITFELTANAETLKIYPFHFSLIVNYILEDAELKIIFTVFNPNHCVLPFSIGFHPAFNTFSALQYFKIEILPKQELLQRTILHNGLLLNQTEQVQLSQKSFFPLSTSLFDKDAVVFCHQDIKEVALVSEQFNYKMQIDCGNCANIGIWTKPNCNNFVCIEPWMGIADSIDTNQNILEKKDIILLAPYQLWNWSISLKFF